MTRTARIVASSVFAIIFVLTTAGCGNLLSPKQTVRYPSSTPRPATSTPSVPSATPLPTYTPVPTSTPPGYYNQYYAGFSLTIPLSWKTTQPDSNSLIMVSPNEPLAIGIFSFPEKTATPFDQILTKVKAELGSEYSFTHVSDGTLALSDAIKAQYSDFTVRSSGKRGDFRMLYSHVGNFTYAITVMTDTGGLETRKLLVDSVVQSIHLFNPQGSDLPHDQTLVLIGGEPDPNNLDPATTTSSAADYIGLLYAGLVRMTPDLKIVPSLADKWTISPDGLVYTFTLAQGLKFASGKALTAQDVKDSWERAADPELGSTTARTYLGDIAGVNAKLDKKADSISGLNAIDAHTLEVKLDGPKPYFLAKLTYPTAFVVDVKSTEKNDWVWSPNASGPYTLKEHQEGTQLVFERNPNYPHKPAIPYVVFLETSAGPAMGLYQTGSLDLLPLNTDQIKQISQPDDPQHGAFVSNVSLCTHMLQFKPGNPPTDDINVRKALSLAIDKSALLERMNMDPVSMAQGVLPPAMPGYLDRKYPGFDPQAAKEALAASKYAAKMPPIKMISAGSAGTASQDPYLLFLIDSWQKVLGIKVEMEYVDLTKSVAMEQSSKDNIVGFSWCADYPDPQNFLDVLFHTRSEFNVGQVSDAELDTLLEAARTELDGQKRLSLYQQAEARIIDQAYSLPTFHRVIGALVKPRVKGFILSPIHASYIPWLTLDPSAGQ